MFEDGVLDHDSTASVRTVFECDQRYFGRTQRPKLWPGRRERSVFRLAKFEAGGDCDARQDRGESDDAHIDG